MRINLFKNPSFETGVGLWHAVGGTLTTSTAQAYSGSKSLKFTGSGTRGRVDPGERIPVTAGKTYTLTGHFYLPGVLSSAHHLSVEFYSGATLKGSSGLGVSPLQTTTGLWVRRSLTFTVPTGATEALVFAPQAAVGFVSATTDVIYIDAMLLEESATFDGYFDGDTKGYEWTGTAHASTSQVRTPVRPIDHARLEISTAPGTWLDVTGASKNISINRHDSDPGTLSAEVLDATLDPTTVDGLTPGLPVRVRVVNGTGWADVYTGVLDGVEARYQPLAPTGKGVNVRLTATDAVSYLANQTEARGVGSINDLRWLVTGVPFNINGQTTGLGSGTIVARNENASLWDQVLITRDSNLGYAWVSKSGVLNVFDATAMDTAIKATIGPGTYSSLDVDFTADQIINTVTVQWLRYDIGTETAAPVPYGPYVDATSVSTWGTRSATFTVQGPTEVEANIAAFAQDVLDRNATAEVRARSAVVPMRFLGDLALVRNLDINSRVSVVRHNGTAQTMRVTGISHTIDAGRWLVTLEFSLPTGLTAPSQAPTTPTSYLPDGAVGPDQLEPDLNNTIQTAAEAAQQALTDADNAQTFAETKNAVFRQTGTPSAATQGPFKVNDLWFDTDDGNRLYLWTGTAWTLATASHLQTPNGRLTIAPTGLTGYDSLGNLKTSLDAGTGAFYTAGPVVSGGSIDGAIITGGTVQTESTASRGIKMSNTGMSVYDALGNPTLTITASTGAVAMKGTLTSGSTITGAGIYGSTFNTSINDTGARTKIVAQGIEFYDAYGNKKLWIYNDEGAARITLPGYTYLYVDAGMHIRDSIYSDNGGIYAQVGSIYGQFNVASTLSTNDIRPYSGNVVGFGPSTYVNMQGTLKSGAKNVSVAALDTDYTASVSFATAFPSDAPVPEVTLNPKVTNSHHVTASATGISRSGFTINYRRSAGSTGAIDIGWIAVAS